MEKADLRALLNRDIDDVVRWAYALTGEETGLDLSLALNYETPFK